MKKADPLIGHWRPPQPYSIAFDAPGADKTYSAHVTQEEERTTGKEEEGNE